MNSQTEDTDIISRLETAIAEDCEAIDPETAFDEMLDETYSFDRVGGPFDMMVPSRVLREMDPIAYRCGVADYSASMQWCEVGHAYYEQNEIERRKDALIEEWEGRESDLETEIDDHDPETDEPGELNALKAELESVRADLATLKAHSF